MKHLSVHQWLRSAIPDSQQPTSPIGFLFLKLPPPPCAVLLVVTSCYFTHFNFKDGIRWITPTFLGEEWIPSPWVTFTSYIPQTGLFILDGTDTDCGNTKQVEGCTACSRRAGVTTADVGCPKKTEDMRKKVEEILHQLGFQWKTGTIMGLDGMLPTNYPSTVCKKCVLPAKTRGTFFWGSSSSNGILTK